MFKMILVSFFLPMEIIPKHIFYFAVNCLHRSWFFLIRSWVEIYPRSYVLGDLRDKLEVSLENYYHV